MTRTESQAAPTRAPYRPISDYGAIGDCRTAALVAPDGAIDWCCLPHFDSPAIFCRTLDDAQGGYFQFAPVAAGEGAMRYLPGTNMLHTRFTAQQGVVDLLDYMPVRFRQRHENPITHFLADVGNQVARNLGRSAERDVGNDVAAAHRINRMATVVAGEATLDLALKVTFDYARAAPQIERVPLDEDAFGALLFAKNRFLVFVLRREGADRALAEPLRLIEADGVLRAQVMLQQGQRAFALLNYARTRAEAQELLQRLRGHDIHADEQETRHYWENWSNSCTYAGPYRQMVLRSALALKLCTFEPTGAIVAAPTTSLPEAIGGARNWDYRFTWLRDSAFTLEALDRLGYQQEARDYFHFLHDLHVRRGMDLRILYGIHGEMGRPLREQELLNLSGYANSRPVRIGNGAADQRQMDIYGELAAAAYRYLQRNGFSRHGGHLEGNRDTKLLLVQVADYVAEHWSELDQGIWEVRGAPRAFVYSRVMCWAALDHAYALGDARQQARWGAARDALRADILAHGYDPERQTFVQSYGSTALDAANLRIPLTKFLPLSDPRMAGTVEAVERYLSTGEGDFIMRYRTTTDTNASEAAGSTSDGVPGTEGAFLACSFWLVMALSGMGRVADARRRFEDLLRYASPLGLFSEEIDPASGAQLGNFPQALTHIGLINAAVAIYHAETGTPGIFD